MKLYRSAPVTHVAPETGSLAAPQKKDIAHREKARVWFPRQTPADSALQPEGGDEGRQPEEQPEETMQGAVTVYQEKKVAAYGRMEKVDEPEAMDAPDVPLADAMSADNPPCDVDYRVVSDGEVLQLGMEEPVAAEEAPVADSPFENMIASVEAGLASMLAEGPPVADEGTTSEEDADDETAALLAGMSEEERAEIAGFDLSLLREDEPEADDSVAPEEALTAGLSKEELAEIAGFDPALLAEAPGETGQVPAAAEAKAVATEEEPAEDVSEAALDAAVQEDRPGEPVVPKADGSDVSAGDSEAKEALLTGAQDVSVSADMAMVPEVATAEEAMPVVGVAGISEEAVAAGDAGLPEAVAQDGQETVVEAAEEQPAMAAMDEAAAEDAALAGALEAAADGEAHVADGDFAGADEGMVEETAPAVGADDVTKQASDVRDAPEPDEAAIPAGEAVFGQKAEMAGLAEEDEHGAAETGKGDLLHGMPSDEAETLPDAEAVPAAIEEGEAQVVEAPLHDAGGDNPSETSAVGLFAERVEEEPTAADAFAGAMASEGDATEAAAQAWPEASDSGAAASGLEEGLPVETGATEADSPAEGAVLADMHGASEPEAAPAGDAASTEADAIATEDESADGTAARAGVFEAAQPVQAAGVQEDMPGAPVMPESSDSSMPASDREEGLPVEASATEADIPEEGAVLVDTQGASEPEDEAAEATPAGEVFSGEAEILSVAGIVPERVEEEPTADVAFAGATTSEGEATEAAAQAGLETAVEEGITETGEEAVSVPEPTGEAATTVVDAIATEDGPADRVAALAAVSEAAQGEQAAGVEEEIPGDAVMQEAGSDGVPAGDEEAASEPEAEKPAEAETGEKAEEAIMAGEGKTAEALLPEASMENPSEAGAAGFAVETVEAGETGPETAVDEGIAESGGEAVSVPEPGREAAAAEQTEEADAGISAGALPDPETALADGILLAEGEALPAAPVPDGMPAAPQGVIPEEEVFRDKMRNHQRNRMAFAEYKVAAAYAREGTDAAYQEAIKWYTRAAEKGHAVSRFNLGNIYYAGRGVEQDYAKAADWYELAARQGVARAQDNLGLMFFHGRGRPVEPEMAVYWFRQAAIQGYAPAQYKLAIHLEAGVGVEPNRAEALYWYRKAASQGHGQAEKEAARLEEEGRR